MLRAILRVVRRVLAALGRGLIQIGALFGRSGGPAMPTPDYEEIVDQQTEELRHDLESYREAAPAEGTSLGARIHAYVAADADGRAGFDFGGVPDDVALTLVSLTEVHLARLAAAGPVVCGRWARGERTGLVGVPPPGKAEAHEEPFDEGDSFPADYPPVPA